MTIFEQLVEALRGQEGRTFTSSEIKSTLRAKFGTNPSSVLPSDYCYNRWNAGVPFANHLFEYLKRGEYLYRGPGYPYTGSVYARPRHSKTDQFVGRVIRGRFWPGGSEVSRETGAHRK